MASREAVYLMNFGVIARDVLTETEAREGQYCEL